MSSTAVEVQIVYEECGHFFPGEEQEIPIVVRTDGTPKNQKRNSTSSSRSSRRNSWKSLLCSGVEQSESESDNDSGLDFQCIGLQLPGFQLVSRTPGLCPDCTTRQSLLIAQQQAPDPEVIRAQVAQEQDEERARRRRAYQQQYAARQAAASYGWKSHRIEPEVISQLPRITGSEPASLPGPAVPRYEDAHIDIERWNAQIQTNRGTAPAPNKPLPLLPLTRKPRAEQVRPHPSTGRHGFCKGVPPLRTRDSDVSAMSGPQNLDDVLAVSSISTRWSSNSQRPKTREGEHNLRRQMSDLEQELDKALESWQQPQPEQRSRRSRR
ncbi:hypothetical protein OCU04_009473 [Sclerotinia nivalis]|uniref:Uncharacterized protein n=1 Tax=Sclerotinia nivalis TaxID=352851 RepID=A0A9X0AF85_9HELO|nr:hypothetical protein OCU04_009473 [Sclerotinia nivalis]